MSDYEFQLQNAGYWGGETCFSDSLNEFDVVSL